MYFLSVVLFLFVLPIASILIELALNTGGSVLMLAAKWFVFWGGGVRLFLAGVRQTLNPAFTAVEIFELEGKGVEKIVREIGFANLSMGLVSLVSLVQPAWVVPAAVVSGLYYGLAGIGHVRNAGRNSKQAFAMVTDLLIFVVLIGLALALIVEQAA